MSLNSSAKEVLVVAGGRIKMQTKTNIFDLAEKLNQEKTASQLIAETLEEKFGHLHLPESEWPNQPQVYAKQCPNCMGIVSPDLNICPHCTYNFKTKKVKAAKAKKGKKDADNK